MQAAAGQHPQRQQQRRGQGGKHARQQPGGSEQHAAEPQADQRIPQQRAAELLGLGHAGQANRQTGEKLQGDQQGQRDVHAGLPERGMSAGRHHTPKRPHTPIAPAWCTSMPNAPPPGLRTRRPQCSAPPQAASAAARRKLARPSLCKQRNRKFVQELPRDRVSGNTSGKNG
ncbi:hypothetical protein D3C81_1450440 [compost metagenome]